MPESSTLSLSGDLQLIEVLWNGRNRRKRLDEIGRERFKDRCFPCRSAHFSSEHREQDLVVCIVVLHELLGKRLWSGL